MANDIDLLISLAELAGVFVGFASLVILIGSGVDTSPGSARSQIKIVVVIGAMVFVAALLPVCLQRYGVAESLVWRISSLLFLIIIWSALLTFGRAEGDYTKEAYLANPPAFLFFWLVLEPAIQIPLILAMFGVYPKLAPAFYLTALIINLGQAALKFLQVVGAAEKEESDRTV
jgi:hypothetical protein